MNLSYYDMQGKLFHHEITSGLVRIGRDQTMDLSLSDPTVSSIHASISRLGDNYFLTDLNSSNGSKLNGTAIYKSILKKGDHIQLGEFSIWFELDAEDKPKGKIIQLKLYNKKTAQTE